METKYYIGVIFLLISIFILLVLFNCYESKHENSSLTCEGSSNPTDIDSVEKYYENEIIDERNSQVSDMEGDSVSECENNITENDFEEDLWYLKRENSMYEAIYIGNVLFIEVEGTVPIYYGRRAPTMKLVHLNPNDPFILKFGKYNFFEP
jgi:hypothetical protein